MFGGRGGRKGKRRSQRNFHHRGTENAKLRGRRNWVINQGVVYAFFASARIVSLGFALKIHSVFGNGMQLIKKGTSREGNLIVCVDTND